MTMTEDEVAAGPQPDSATRATKPQRRWPRRVAVVSIVLIVLIVAGLGGIGWYFSSEALAVTHDHLSYNYRVLALHGHTVTIPQSGNTVRPGTYRLQWRGGQIMLGAIVSKDGQTVTRQFTGSARGLRVGTPTHFDGYIYGTPAALGLRYRSVNIPDPLGAMPAWLVPGKRSTWVITLHGRGMSRSEAMRPLSTFARLGLPVLDMTYRNDVGAPASSDHLIHYGATEWQDLQAGVRYALAHGAHDVILFGFSYGGGTVESFLHRSSYAGKVRAAVLDSPMLDASAIFSFRAAQRNIPGPIVAVAKPIIAWRLGLSSLDETNKLLPNVNYQVPTLFFQGTADTSLPPQRNIELARMRPGQVTLVVFPGAEHTQEWNNNPVRYSRALKSYLTRVLG